MTERIAVGDLVWLVKSLAGNEGAIGTVEGFAPAGVENMDPAEGQRAWVRFSRPLKSLWGIPYNPAPCPVSWLRRIDGGIEIESTKTNEPLKEPA